MQQPGQFPRGANPLADAPLRRAGHDRLQVAVKRPIDRAQQRDVFFVDKDGQLRLVLRLGKQPAAGQQFPQRRPQTAHVRRGPTFSVALASCSGAA